MTSKDRHEARYLRRKAARELKHEKLSRYDNFDNITDFDNLYEAYKKCMLNVGWKESIQRFEFNAMRYALETRRKLLAGESVHKGFMEFDLFERGKKRHIKSLHILERGVHAELCERVLIPLLSNSLIYDNGASQKGKGVHFALRRLICHLSRYYRVNKVNEGYALSIDFSKYFDSVDHDVLFGLLREKIKDKRILGLTEGFIKTFGEGLGLGSQVSQICAIFYPNKLDHYIKEVLGIKYYARYMDDLYLIHRDREYLKYCLSKIIKFCEKLKITVNLKKTRIVKLSQGMVFLKGRYILLPSGKILRLPCRESSKRMRRKLDKFRKLLNSGKIGYKDISASYQSWRGNFRRRFNAYHRVRHIDKYYNDLFIWEH